MAMMEVERPRDRWDAQGRHAGMIVLEVLVCQNRTQKFGTSGRRKLRG